MAFSGGILPSEATVKDGREWPRLFATVLFSSGHVPTRIFVNSKPTGTATSGTSNVLRRSFVFGLGLIALPTGTTRAFAQSVAAIKAMMPGEFVWRPELSTSGPVVIVVSLPYQTAARWPRYRALERHASGCPTTSQVADRIKMNKLAASPSYRRGGCRRPHARMRNCSCAKSA